MGANYKIGQQPQAQPMEQYPPFYDPQKQKEKQDLENAPMQLMNMFANAKGFEGASWQMEEVTSLNNELNAKMKYILFSDYPPAAKQYAAAALLIDNISGEMYNKRVALSEFKAGEDDFTAKLNEAVKQRFISQEEAGKINFINMAQNKKNYEENGSKAQYKPYQFFSLNNFDNYYGPKLQASKNESVVQISGLTTGNTQKDLTAEGAKPSTTATSVITPGLGNASFTYYSVPKYEDDVADLYIDEFSISNNYMTKVNLYNDYIAAYEYENNTTLDDTKKEKIKKEIFLNSPVILKDGKILTDKDEISAVAFGLKPAEIKNGKKVGETTYTFNYKEFADNNKDRFINKDEIQSMERIATTRSSKGETKVVYVPGYKLTGDDGIVYTNESIPAQQTIDTQDLMADAHQLFIIDYDRFENFEELNNTAHAKKLINGFKTNKPASISSALSTYGYISKTKSQLLYPSAGDLLAYTKSFKEKNKRQITKEEAEDYMHNHAVIALSTNHVLRLSSDTESTKSREFNDPLVIPVITKNSTVSGNTNIEFSQAVVDIIKTLPTEQEQQAETQNTAS